MWSRSVWSSHHKKGQKRRMFRQQWGPISLTNDQIKINSWIINEYYQSISSCRFVGRVHRMFSSVSLCPDDLRPFEIVQARSCCIVLDNQLVVSGSQGAVEQTWIVLLCLCYFLWSLRVYGFVELIVGLGLVFVVVGNLRHVFFPSVCDLEKEHSIVVDDIEEDDNVDDER